MQKNRLSLAILFSIFGSFAYVLLFSKGKEFACIFSFNQLMFIRSFVSFCCICAIQIVFGKKNSVFILLNKTKMSAHLIRSITGLITAYLSLAATRYCSLAEANLLLNTTPFFIPFIAFVWKKEKINSRIWPGIMIAFTGVYFILHPSYMKHNIGIWYGLLGGIVGALSIVAFTVTSRTEPIIRSLFYHLLIFTIVSGVLCIPEGIPLNLDTCKIACILGTLGLSALLFTSFSLKYAPPDFISPFAYSSVVLGLIIDYFVWNSPPSFLEIGGIVLVLIGLYVMVYLLKKPKDQKSV